MDGSGGGFLALVCTVVVVLLSIEMVQEFPGWAHVGNGVGIAVLLIGGVLLAWKLFGAKDPTGLEIAQKAVKKLEEEEAARSSIGGWQLLVGAAVVVLVVASVAGVVWV